MDDMQAELARLKAEHERLKRQQASPLSLKVSGKGRSRSCARPAAS